MKPKYEVAPSILSADFSRLADEIRSVEPYSGRIHVDVMDGHFVPNLTMGPGVVTSIRPVTSLPIEVHLMVEDPALFIEPFAGAGANRLIFHVEVAGDVEAMAHKIRAAGPTAGVALKPDTDFSQVAPWLELVDLVIVMTVEPGFGGQPFMAEMIPKITQARRAVMDSRLDVDIEVDGGIESQTARWAREAGANVFVAGNAIFGTPDPAASARAIAEAIGADRG